MQYREVGQSGLEASVVGFGTWAIGGDQWWDKKSDDEQSIAAIRAALDNGVNLIDTAPGYGRGHSEQVVGRAIEGRDRSKVFISTKCGIIWWGNQGGFMGQEGEFTYYRNLEPDSIREQAEKSMERMKIDYIDIMFTHWPSLESFPTPIARTMEGLMKLKEEGIIKAIGASNVSVDQMKEYLAAGQLDVIQPPYSMLNRGIEDGILPFCRENKISVFAYSPLEQGLLTGKLRMDFEVKKGTSRDTNIPWYKPENRKKVIDMVDGWKDIAERHQATISQIVIAWTFSQPGVTHTLIGARKPEHAIENVKGGDIRLSQDELDRMRRDAESLGEPV